MSKTTTRGFTLIELLVVIAIIGILSAVVLASLNTARTKGNYAAIKETLHGMQTSAELYYSNNNNYGTAVGTTSGTTCTSNGMFGDTRVTTAVASLVNEGATYIGCGIGASGTFYDIIVQSPGGNWCVNSLGNVGTTTC